ncbi:MAG: O-antigen ligase family protein [Magnetococcales bacterium]|nr:O-antigen ligase family protein [Magnetococcales bacterium]
MRDNYFDAHIFWAFLLVLVWAPLPLGSNRVWAWNLLAGAIFGLLALLFVTRLGYRGSWGRVFEEYAPQMILLLFWVLVPLLQVVDLHPGLMRLISPATIEVYRFAGLADGAMTISLDREATLSEWLKYMSYLGAGFLVLALAGTRERVRQLALTLFLVGCFEALFGMGIYLTRTDLSWWVPINPFQATGTFVNRNHFAGLLAMTLSVGLGLLIGWMRRGRSEWSWRDTLLGLMQDLGGRRGVMAGLIISMFLALFLSQSRAGTLAVMASLTLIAFLAHFRRRKSTRERRLIFPILILALIGGLWLGLGHLAGRFVEADLDLARRVYVFNGTVEKIGNFPGIGTGSGTFQYTYPLYRTEAVTKFYQHVHNDYLEILSDQGLLGFGLLGSGVLSCWLIMVRRYLKRRDPFARGILFASLAGTMALLIHGLVDFNFQIPSNALYFWVLLAMGLQAAVLPHQQVIRSRATPKTSHFPSELSR